MHPNLTGLRFGKLLVVKDSTQRKNGEILWECVCDCGKVRLSRTGALRHKQNISCGCQVGNPTHRESGNRIRRIWINMHSRCYKSTNNRFHCYGGRGISICPEWQDYLNFKKWAYENGYADHLSIDRIDTNGNYNPSNCSWSTVTEQARNTRSNRILTFNGKSQCIASWGEETGIGKYRIAARLSRGWTINRALSELPIKKYTSNRYRNANS